MDDCSDELLRVNDALLGSLLTKRNCGGMIGVSNGVFGELHSQWACPSPDEMFTERQPEALLSKSTAPGGSGSGEARLGRYVRYARLLGLGMPA